MRLLFVLLLLAIPAAAAEIDVTRYDIEVAVNPDSVEAKVRLTATTDRPPNDWEVALSPRMQIQKLTVNGVEVPAKREGARLLLDLSKLPKGAKTIALEAVVAGSPKGGGGGRKSTLISPTHARIRHQQAWYPRVPDDHAAYRTVVSARKDWSVRTAGVETSVAARGDRRVWTYEQERPVRHIGLVAGPYIITKLDAGGGGVLDAWTLPGDEAAAAGILKLASDAFARYRKWFGDVGVDRFSLLEMPAEYGTMSGYGEPGYILLGKGAFERGSEDPATVDLVVHEVAHTWWGTEVGFANFAHESLASYSTLRYLGDAGYASVAGRVRKRAVESVVNVAQAAKDVALSDIRAYGRGMQPGVYRALAYEKGMLILAMVEDAVGTKKMDKLLAGFLTAHRGAMVTWVDLRAALLKGGSAAKTILAQWEQTGIPTLTLEYTAEESRRKWKVIGTVTQTGTAKPFRMSVNVVAICGSERIEKAVDLKRGETGFTLSTPARPGEVFLDPDWRLLVDAPREVFLAEKALDRAYAVVSNPNDRDPDRCTGAIRLLRRVLDEGPEKHAAASWSGIGRCQFRLGKDEEARKSLRRALAVGAHTFHRGWVNLRLGNLADLAGERERALRYYRDVTAPGSRASRGTRQRAEKYVKTPFRR